MKNKNGILLIISILMLIVSVPGCPIVQAHDTSEKLAPQKKTKQPRSSCRALETLRRNRNKRSSAGPSPVLASLPKLTVD